MGGGEEARRRVGGEARRRGGEEVDSLYGEDRSTNYPNIAFHLTSLPSFLTSICYESRRGEILPFLRITKEKFCPFCWYSIYFMAWSLHERLNVVYICYLDIFHEAWSSSWDFD